MHLREIRELVRIQRPPAPYGVRRLARCVSVEDVARLARRRLPAAASGYLDGGGEDEWTLRRNRAAFDNAALLPHVLRDVSDIDTSATLLGTPSPVPFALAPVGAPRVFHHEGELAAARAAHRAGVPYAVSTLGTQRIEDIAAAGGALWFQLYVWGDRGLAKELIARAGALGYRALLVSVDTSLRSKREREERTGLSLPSPNLTARSVLEAALRPSWSWHFLTTPAITFPNVDGATTLADMFDGTVSWHDVEWIRHSWDGPLALKGVLNPDDAERAAEAGVDAVIVSNHGGRQLDHLPATLDALPAVVDAVGDRVEVLMDSGIRRGTDIVTALASGARGVLVGRAYLYGLAAAGEAGVRHVIDILTDELRVALGLCGASRLADLDASLLQ